ncbi:MAG TPA: hypothetical protein VE733_00890 [Streptosporangiaceae bacterium]|jgi:hypothetical protein|nr:hypothetical protein [Streptosporangiaceae bacterium]
MIGQLAHRKLFVASQADFTYLQDNNSVEAIVATDDGAAGLGTQRTVARYAR